MRRRSSGGFAVILAGALATLSACNGHEPGAVASPPPPPAVVVTRVASEEITPSLSFTGRVEAVDKVDLRARVDGFLEKRLFAEGTDVAAGDLLFVIEKGLYQAAVDESSATLQKAEAALALAEVELERQQTLVSRNAGAQARLDEAKAKHAEAKGDLALQQATLEKARLQLSYTEIRAAIAGRIGRSAFSVGDFVGPSSGALATIVSQDPIHVSFPVTARDILAIRKGQGGEVTPEQAVVRVRLADGSLYPLPGKIDFVDVTVNRGTDSVQVRASFPNPDRLLTDGQLVTVIAESGKAESALLVPQQALQIDQTGAFVLVVDDANKVQVRRIETGPGRGADIVVRKGLAPGERVVTEGIQKVRPGQVVQPTQAKREV